MTYLRTYQSLRPLDLISRTQDVLAGYRRPLYNRWLTPPNAINAPVPPQIPTVSYPMKSPRKTHMRVASQEGTLLVPEPLDEEDDPNRSIKVPTDSLRFRIAQGAVEATRRV